MEKPTQKKMNVIYALLIFSPVFVQAGNMWTTNGMETSTDYNAVRTPAANEQVNQQEHLITPDQTVAPMDQMTTPAAPPRLYNTDPSLRSQNLYGTPAPTDTATDYNLDTAPDKDR